MVTVEARAAAARRALIPQWQLPVDEIAPGGSPLTLRELIERMVRREVAAFRGRRSERQLVRVLSERELAESAERGRVSFGASEVGEQTADDDLAVGVALESFEDGLYYVLIDGTQYESLEEQVHLGTDSRITFLRLVALAGG
jgi:hypothetical protein